ncbi:hypothetical protein VNI00_002162 [Paramarasmius palmivorus]|uniref:Uncharacterized protein n=1 Tax=Paramarasmius palmivorus TaxID=297713 RepID=A0AAW0E0D1_9AGAR
MSLMTKTTTTTTATANNNTQEKPRSLLVAVIAGAISSVGFGVSLVAIGVFWLFPSALAAPPPPSPVQKRSKRQDKSRRRSAPPALGTSQASLSISSSSPITPIIVVPVLVPQVDASTSSTRRVYFLEHQTRPRSSRRYSTPAGESPQSAPAEAARFTIPEDVSPRSSSSTLVHIPNPPQLLMSLDPCDEAAESTASEKSSRPSSSRTSSFISSALPNRFKGRWGTKRSGAGNSVSDSPPETPAQLDDEASISSASTSNKSATRKSGVCAPWSISTKAHTTVDISIETTDLRQPDSLSTSESQPLSPALDSEASSSYLTLTFHRPRKASVDKTARRTSAPIRRTQPYSYPYFAEPPAPVGAADSDNEKTRSPISDRRSSEEQERETTKREKNRKAQAALGHGRAVSLPRRAATMAV